MIAPVLRTLLLLAVLAMIIMNGALYAINGSFEVPSALTVIAILLLCYWLTTHGHIKQAGIILITSLWLATTWNVARYGGVYSSFFASYIVVILLAGLLTGVWSALALTVLTMATSLIVYSQQLSGALPSEPVETLSQHFVAANINLLVSAVVISLILHQLAQVMEERRRANLQLEGQKAELKTAADELTGLNSELKQSELRYRTLVDYAPEAILVIDSETNKLVDVNDAAVELFGYARADWLRMPPHQLGTILQLNSAVIMPESNERAGSNSTTDFTGAHPTPDQAHLPGQAIYERAFTTRTGHEFMGEVRLVGLPSSEQSLARYSITDISERKATEALLENERRQLSHRVEERTAELRRVNAELLTALQSKDEFLASVSHELRTPLMAILGSMESLLIGVHGPVPPAHQRILTRVENSGQHLLSLINDVLDMAKIEAGELNLQPVELDIAAVTSACLEFVRHEADKKSLTLSVELAPALPPFVGDERRVKQILINLLSNAVKFTERGGSVGLRVTPVDRGNAITFTVWDTGIGIHADDMEKIFQPFQQIDSRLAREYEGTGLGLALVRRLTDLHGGDIQVVSQAAQGTSFNVTLTSLEETKMME